MAKYVCTVCGYVYEGDAAPEICPVCKAPAEKFKLQEGEKVWAAEHVVGVAKGVSEDIVSDLRANFEGECSEVGMYLAMARVAYREGYPEVGSYYEKAAWEEAEHAAKFAELLGEVVTDRYTAICHYWQISVRSRNCPPELDLIVLTVIQSRITILSARNAGAFWI